MNTIERNHLEDLIAELSTWSEAKSLTHWWDAISRIKEFCEQISSKGELKQQKSRFDRPIENVTVYGKYSSDLDETVIDKLNELIDRVNANTADIHLLERENELP